MDSSDRRTVGRPARSCRTQAPRHNGGHSALVSTANRRRPGKPPWRSAACGARNESWGGAFRRFTIPTGAATNWAPLRFLGRDRTHSLSHALLYLAAAAGRAGQLFVVLVILVPIMLLKTLQRLEFLPAFHAFIVVIRHDDCLL